MRELFADYEIFARSMVSALLAGLNGRLGTDYYFWDDAPQQSFDNLRQILSQTEDNERRLIRRVLRDADPSSVLDAPCGFGTELTGYQKHGLELDYVGMDLSDRMLDVCTERHSDGKFLKGDVTQMPFPDKSFDAVLLKHILEHLPDYKPAVEEAVRVARNNVIINFFRPFSLVGRDIPIWTRHGYWDNWYSRKGFEGFLETLPIRSYERFLTKGHWNQTAMVYVLDK